MSQEPFERAQQTSLRQVREGMDVFDRDGDKLGSVDRVYFGATEEAGRGAATPSTPGERQDSIFDNLAQALFGNDAVPEAARARMMQEGFVRIDSTGLFAADRYVLPQQIERVEGDRVYLNATRDDLIKHTIV